MLGSPHAALLFVYILASRRHGTLYTGVTNDLVRRIHEHREGLVPGFTRSHGCKHLMWFETHGEIEQAILRERRIKRWRRSWQEASIEAANPDWRDLWWRSSGNASAVARPKINSV